MSMSEAEAIQISRGNIGSGCTSGHTCTSSCGKDYDCPCQSEHCCDMSDEKCGELDSCEYCASLVPDLADLKNDEINDR